MNITFQRQTDDSVETAAAGPTADTPATTLSEEQHTKIAELLVQLRDYVTANIDQHRELTKVAGLLQSAVAAWEARLAVDPFVPLQRVAAAIKAAQQADPTLPR